MVIFLDSGDIAKIAVHLDRVHGVTTNPSILKTSGIRDYKTFALEVLELVRDKPVSFEVFADDADGMVAQARTIAKWGDNVFVKIPVTTTTGESTERVCWALSQEGVKLNVTAIMTLEQIRAVARYLNPLTPAIISIFCGRIADTGRDPVPFITEATRVKHNKTKILWASTRELLNIKQAEQAGADIITVTPEILAKMHLFGKDLTQYSLDTVKMFYEDGKGLSL